MSLVADIAGGGVEGEPIHNLLEAAFPFHVVVDRSLTVLHVGRSIPRLSPTLTEGARLEDHVELISPPGPIKFDRLCKLGDTMILFRLRSTGAILRCQLVVSAVLGRDDTVLGLLGSPWITDPKSLQELGLTLSDFAPHDPTPDYMFLAQAQSTALQDAQRLAERLESMDKERARLAQAEQALARELNALPDLVMRLNRKGEILDFRGSAQAITAAEAVGRSAFKVFPEMGERLSSALRRAFLSMTTQSFEYTVGAAEHAQFFEARIVRCSDIEGLLLVRDVTERRSLEIELAHQAFHDKLTGLANRALFQERIEQALNIRDEARGAWLSVLFIDLDNFKTVNDTMGHGAGDELLIVLADRLRACIRSADTVARFGGDEFAILVQGASESQAIELAERIIDSVCQPIRVQGRDVTVSASVGLVSMAAGRSADRRCNSRNGEESEELLRSADVAMYWAKSAGKGRLAIYEPTMDEHLLGRVLMEAELKTAVAEGQFIVHYQPIVALASGRMIGVEALVRWRKSDGSLVSPADFIPIAEETGLIVPIGEMVLREACHQLCCWDRAFPDRQSFTVSVNLSVVQLVEPGLVQMIRSVLETTGLEPSRLTLEITETALLTDAKRVALVVHEIGALGVRLALDDFGTGYSSLSHLRQFPINTIKIDKSFVDNMLGPEGDGVIAAALLEMSRVLNVNVIAEGVELPEQVAALQAMRCGSAQGYFFAKPMGAVDLSQMLLAEHRGHELAAVEAVRELKNGTARSRKPISAPSEIHSATPDGVNTARLTA